MTYARRLTLAHMWFAFAAFAVAAVLGVWQMWARSPLPAPFLTAETYFTSVTAHGVAMAYVLPTFVVMGFGYYVAETALARPLPHKSWAWLGFGLGVVGSAMAALTVFAGRATVLFTFYPPLVASPFFYIGLVLVVAGSWIWCLVMMLAMAQWKRENPGAPVPLAMFATVANAVMWLWTTVGVAAELVFQIIPASLGYNGAIDVGLSRTLFSWTLHAIVYFWLIPAYIAFYTMAPQAAGGRLYSDTMGRLTFILFLIYSLPVGIHHLLMDPQQSNAFKFLQMSFTALVARADAPDGVHDHRLDGDRGAVKRRARPLRLDLGPAVGAADGARHGARLLHALVRRRRRAHQHELRHERHGPQHLVGDGAFPPDLRRHRRDHVLRHRLRDLAGADRAHAGLAAQPAPPALAVVRRHDGHDPALALSSACRGNGGASRRSTTPTRSSPRGAPG